jgi:LysR family transcriptional regulator, glycine cleavage system transcriptional activator
MSRRLPPLNALRAFEAAARRLSFTKAAEELSVTPAAVSQHVKLLEEYFGIVLFRRLTRALRLTSAGQAVLPLLQEGFDKLAEADRILRRREDERVLTVSVAPSFGARWLVPRLDRFHRAHPEYDIRLDATDRRVDFVEDNVDIALRYGRGRYRGLCSERLFAEVSFPVCSPALLDGDPPLRTLEDLRHHTLLHVQWQMETDAAPSWRMWLRAAGLDDLPADRGPRFSVEDMAVQAAIAGQGVALVSSALVADDLARGVLVRPFPEAGDQATEFCYFLVYPKAYLQRPKVAAFRDWVKAEVEGGPASP